jgi:hypothetical protein
MLSHPADKFLLVSHVWLDGVEEQVICFFLFVLQLLYFGVKDFGRWGFEELDTVLLAFGDEIWNFALCFVANFYALRIRQHKGLLVFVEVNKVGCIGIAKRFYNFPGVILGNNDAVQLHEFRSSMMWVKFLHTLRDPYEILNL